MPFSQSAHLYDAIYGKERDYASQAAAIADWILRRNGEASSLLDVACGTGLHLSHLGDRFQAAGVDVSQAMVGQAQKRNPAARIERGDMRSFRLGCRFDAVTCMFSSITYTGTVDGLNQTLKNFADHLNPGGVCIVEPYLTPQSWDDAHGPGLRTARNEEFTVALVDRAVRNGRDIQREIAYAVASADATHLFREMHEFRLFTSEEYTAAFRGAGFDVTFDARGFDAARGMYFGTLVDRST
ncbi:class I SAM-dependent methyltransferase [Streptomyces sp. NPDC052107]|uniref:class I SAM-dependent DNA methyltransferase n=1 Tax=Streptomyces sp. NPDC052107 TaxID=3155632 RepID=UPI0034122104